MQTEQKVRGDWVKLLFKMMFRAVIKLQMKIDQSSIMTEMTEMAKSNSQRLCVVKTVTAQSFNISDKLSDSLT